MEGKVLFALVTKGAEHKYRRVQLNSPVRLVRQPDRRWAIFMHTVEDMQSAEIIRRMGPVFSITPMDDQSVVTQKGVGGVEVPIPPGRTKRVLSKRTTIVYQLKPT